MKILSILFFALSIFSEQLFCQDTAYYYFGRNFERLEKDSAFYYAMVYRDRDSGYWKKKDFWVQGNILKMEGSYLNPTCQTKHGLFKLYKSNGLLDYSAQYKSGTQLYCTTFYENGNKKSFIEYEKGVTQETEWDENGQEKLFRIIEREVRFPGGPGSWQKYLQKYLNAQVASDSKAPVGHYTVRVKFIVDELGKMTDVQAVSVPERCKPCGDEAVRIMKKSPNWEPAIKNGQPVHYQGTQHITFSVAEQ